MNKEKKSRIIMLLIDVLIAAVLLVFDQFTKHLAVVHLKGQAPYVLIDGVLELQCMNTGHDGSMSTGHANSAADMLSRLENMVLMGMDLPLPAIRNQIASGVDIIVHLGRIRDKSRKVLEITEVVGCENGEIRLNPLYCFEELGESSEGNVVGKLQKKGGLLHEGKLKAAGLL